MKKILSIIFLSSILFISLNAKTNTEINTERLEILAKYAQIIKIIEEYYVDDIQLNDIVEKSIDGMLSNLDPHSNFLNKDDYEKMKVSTNGEFAGIGITVGIRDNTLTVISPIDGTPGFKAGIKAGDKIIKIDGKFSVDMKLDKAVSLMRGKKGEKVILTIARENEPKPLTIEIIRDIIKVPSVKIKKIEGTNILYVRISSFDQHVKEDLDKAILNNKDVVGMILDLRNNPGGLLNQAVEVVDTFVDEGIIVSQKGKIKSEENTYYAKKDTTLFKKPVVVLVNSGSASASEIVSGALQQSKRAIVIGETTFGKGSVQVVLPLNNDEAVKLTIAKYYLDNNVSIQATGVKPDIEAFFGPVPTENNDFLKITENELSNHLNNETVQSKDEEEKVEDIDEEKVISKKMIFEDNQLFNAINTIKILNITQLNK